MPLLKISELSIDEDSVLRNLGVDPGTIRQRKPELVEMTRRALLDGRSFLEPQILYRKLKVKSFRHQQVLLEDGNKLSGQLIADHLGFAEYVVLLLCTVGDRIEAHISAAMGSDVLYGLALDGFGSAAVEALANAACNFFEEEAAETGLQPSVPLSPGMIGWDVERGQRELFEILDGSQVVVTLSERSVMIPRKSLTMAVGFGQEASTSGRTCDFCAMKERCHYKDHYAPVA